MNKKIKHANNRSSRIGIKWKMFALLIIFTVLAIIIIWICGVQMLSRFYQRMKFNELKFSDTSITAILSDKYKISESVNECAEEYNIDTVIEY